MTAYWELLRDPRWQRKRLEIMQRDNFRCGECDDGEATLNVHHRHYIKGRKPWEYEDSALITLCERCHKRVEEQLATLHELVGACDFISRPIAIGFLHALIRLVYNSESSLGDEIPVSDLFELDGIALYLSISRAEVLNVAGAPPMDDPALGEWLKAGHSVSANALWEYATKRAEEREK